MNISRLIPIEKHMEVQLDEDGKRDVTGRGGSAMKDIGKTCKVEGRGE